MELLSNNQKKSLYRKQKILLGRLEEIEMARPYLDPSHYKKRLNTLNRELEKVKKEYFLQSGIIETKPKYDFEIEQYILCHD